MRQPAERARIQQIELEELEHRRLVGSMLEKIGVVVDPGRERRMRRIGQTIAWLCRVGAALLPLGRIGWFLANLGAGRLESRNIVEYEDAARLALAGGCEHLVDDLLTLAEVEHDHERYFRELISAHFLYSWFPRWQVPPPREQIRASMPLARAGRPA